MHLWKKLITVITYQGDHIKEGLSKETGYLEKAGDTDGEK